MSAPTPLRGRILSIAELAREQGVPKRTLAERLKKLDALYGNKILIRPKTRNGKILVREDVLKLAVLGLEEKSAPVPRAEFDELYEAVRALKKQANAQGARIRKLEEQASSMPTCSCRYTIK